VGLKGKDVACHIYRLWCESKKAPMSLEYLPMVGTSAVLSAFFIMENHLNGNEHMSLHHLAPITLTVSLMPYKACIKNDGRKKKKEEGKDGMQFFRLHHL